MLPQFAKEHLITERRSIAIIYPRLGRGGSEARALWAIDALKGSYDVTLVTAGEADFASLNAYYGTQLSPGDVPVLRAPLPPLLRDTGRFSALRGHLFQRFCQKIASKFDLMINAYNPMDFGVPGVQFIADFSFDDEMRRELDSAGRGIRRIVYGANPLRKLYLFLCSAISPNGPERWRHNLTVANSEWTQSIVARRYGLEARIVYPPVLGQFADVPIGERENGFVCLGRLVSEKRMDVVIEVLHRVRQRGHDVHLHIMGGGENAYVESLRDLAADRDWVFLEGWVGGEEKARMMTSHRFGINGRLNEPFGIAVAEMVKAGCTVFVPSGGGQVDIVNHPSLIFDDEDSAVDKICNVLENPSLQNSLGKHLAQRMDRFSVEAFQNGVQEVVRDFFNKSTAPSIN